MSEQPRPLPRPNYLEEFGRKLTPMEQAFMLKAAARHGIAAEDHPVLGVIAEMVRFRSGMQTILRAMEAQVARLEAMGAASAEVKAVLAEDLAVMKTIRDSVLRHDDRLESRDKAMTETADRPILTWPMWTLLAVCALTALALGTAIGFNLRLPGCSFQPLQLSHDGRFYAICQ